MQLPDDIFQFFNELAKNNTREWFQDHKPRFKSLEQDVKLFGEKLKGLLNTEDRVDRAKLFRIYRDVRFSKDKTPFKTHFGISFHREKPALRGGYYLHIKPGDNFIATGFWNPNKEDLLRIRKEMEIDPSEFREIMENVNFKKVWGYLEGEEVKTAPKNFSKDDPNIDLIRKKQYIFTKSYSDKEVLAPNFIENVHNDFKTIRPFFDYMSDVLTTNTNGESLI